MSRTQNGTNKTYTHLLCVGTGPQIWKETLWKKQGVESNHWLFLSCNFHNLWINIYWEKNKRHYFLGNLQTIWLKMVQWFWCYFLQTNIMTLGISTTFQMHLKPIVNLTVIMSPSMRFSCLPGGEVQFQHKDELVTMSFHVNGVTWVQVYIHNFTPNKHELHMK